MMQWRQDFLRGVTPSAADVAAEAATGKAYLHSHKDVNGRPVIVIRASRHITGEALLIALNVPLFALSGLSVGACKARKGGSTLHEEDMGL